MEATTVETKPITKVDGFEDSEFEDEHDLGFNWDPMCQKMRSLSFKQASNNPKNAQINFKSKLNELGVSSEAHYQHALTYDAELANLAVAMNGQGLEACKKQMFEINRQTITPDTYKQRVQRHEIDNKQDPQFVRGLTCAVQILKSLAKENHVSYEDMLYNIFSVMNMSRHKVNTVVFIGASDSGKSFVADLFASPFELYEIGQFALPTAKNTNQFWLEPLVGKQVYRAEELFIADEVVLQDVKKLFEGSPALVGGVKYKSALTIERRPVLVSMNGDSEYAVTRGMSNEFDTIANRSFIYVMREPVKTRYHMGSIVQAGKYMKQIVNLLYQKYGDTDDKGYDSDDIDLCNAYLSENL